MTPLQAAYDSNVLPHLQRIRHCAKRVSYYSKEVAKAASQMEFLPDWLTIAEADLSEALKQIEQTVEVLQAKTREKV